MTSKIFDFTGEDFSQVKLNDAGGLLPTKE